MTTGTGRLTAQMPAQFMMALCLRPLQCILHCFVQVVQLSNAIRPQVRAAPARPFSSGHVLGELWVELIRMEKPLVF